MSVMSTGEYVDVGRHRQKRRTRDLLVAAAQELVREGAVPTVDGVAERAEISRTTAYRYFPNQRLLLAAAHPETDDDAFALDGDDDPVTRLATVVERFTTMIADTEAQQRTMLRLSLADDPTERGGLPLRQGRAIGWFSEALAPLRGQLTDAALDRLVLAIRSCCGIEALVWLVDIAGLERTEAVNLMRWSAAALLQAALVQGHPGKGSEV